MQCSILHTCFHKYLRTDIPIYNVYFFTEVQPQIKDKSAWRKSNLNVANSTEETKDYTRHTLPRITRTDVSNCEDHDRKNLIKSLGDKHASDRLTLYIRRPSDTSSVNQDISSNCQSEQESDQQINNSVEVDQDNIETPPTTRKIFTPTPVDKREPVQPSPCRRMLNRASKESLASPDGAEPNTSLGDGQFDRFDVMRRTKRYKTKTEQPREVVAQKEIIKAEGIQVESSIPIKTEPIMDKESRLKAWQEKKSLRDNEVKISNKRNRNQTIVNQDDIKSALKMSAPINIETPDGKNLRMPRSYINQDDGVRKSKEHDNDEGFEETQSLMSESPSQGASSGGNFEVDIVVEDFNKDKIQEKNTVVVKVAPNQSHVKAIPRIKDKFVQNAAKSTTKVAKAFDRSTPLRHTIINAPDNKRSTIPRRTGSLRKTDSQTNIPTPKKNIVQRSGSKNSIAGSRTSINSATSTNTVKRLPLKPSNTNTPQPKVIPRSSSIKTFNSTAKNIGPVKKGTNITSVQKPPRPQISSSSFMKPTTASGAKTHPPSLVPTRLTASFRSKH